MGEGSIARDAARWLAMACVAYPWLHVGAHGPWVAVEPALLALACVLVLLVITARRSSVDAPRGLVMATLVSIALLWIADAIARGDARPTPSVVFTAIALTAMACCAVVVRTDRAEGTRWLACGWLIAAVASTVIALSQYAGATSWLGTWAAPSPLHHAFANLRQRNHYATLACIGLASAMVVGVHARDMRTRVLAAGSAAFISLGLAASASRTGLVELLVLLALWLGWRDRHHRRWALMLVAAYALGALALLAAGGAGIHGVLHRLAGDAPDCQGRRVLWSTMLDLIAQRPWTGWGWDGLPLAVYGSSTEPHFCALVENAHDLPLHLAVTLGLPLALVACVAAASGIARLRPWRVGDDSAQLGVPVLAVLAVHSVLEYPLWYGPFQMAFGFALGLVWREQAGWQVRRTAMAAIALIGLAMGAFIAFDYLRVSQPYLAVEERMPWARYDALSQAQRSWLFADFARYAEFMGLPLTPQTAAHVDSLSAEVMRFQPVPGVLDKRIASERMLGRDAQADEETRRLLRAYPR